MLVKCPKCESDDVTLKVDIEDIEFRFDEKRNVVLLTDVEDEIYWEVEYEQEYEQARVFCECKKYGNLFTYDDWKKSIK